MVDRSGAEREAVLITMAIRYNLIRFDWIPVPLVEIRVPGYKTPNQSV